MTNCLFAACVTNRAMMLRLANTVRSCTRMARPLRSEHRQLHEHFCYNRAIVGSLNNRFEQDSLRFQEPREPISLAKAREQHANYVKQLRVLLPGKIVQIPPNDSFPDQVYVEDPAVIHDEIALLTNMRANSRAGGKQLMRRALEEIGMQVVEMKNPEAHLDGGDVLFTGREFFVGISSRTNAVGIKEFADVFSKWPVTGITVEQGSGVLHLKSMSSMCAMDTIAISSSRAGLRAWKEIETQGRYRYKSLFFPDDNGANCLFINGVVLHPSRLDYPESFKVWQTLECEKIELPNSELIKADGSLTCNSILIK